MYSTGPRKSGPTVIAVDGIIRPGVRCDYRIRLRNVERWRDSGPRWKYYAVAQAKETLKNPICVYEGLQREAQDEGICIVGRPAQIPKNDGTLVPFPKGFLFLVFANADRIVVNWRVDMADKDDPDVPYDSINRFRKNLWKQ